MLYFRNLTILLLIYIFIPLLGALISNADGVEYPFFGFILRAYVVLLLIGIIFTIVMPRVVCPGCNEKIFAGDHLFCRKCGTKFDYNLYTKQISNVFIEDMFHVKAMEKRDKNKMLASFVVYGIFSIIVMLLTLKYFESVYFLVIGALMFGVIPLKAHNDKTRFKAN